MVAIDWLPKELETRMKPSSVSGLTSRDYEAWNNNEEVSADIAAKCEAFTAECRAERERRFDLLLEHEGLDELVSDDSETGRKWRALALKLVGGARYVGLEWAEPKNKAGRPRDAVPKVLIRVAAQFWKAHPNQIKQAAAIKLADVNEGYFFEAKDAAGLTGDPEWWRRFPPENDSGK
jgi:hypothetical protein